MVDIRDIVAAWNVGNNKEVFVYTVSEASDEDSTKLQVEDIRDCMYPWATSEQTAYTGLLQ